MRTRRSRSARPAARSRRRRPSTSCWCTRWKAKRVGYSEQAIADGATGFWKLQEPSGTSVVSAVGSHPGTISGGVTLNQPGPMDASKAMLFDGVNGRISMGDDAAFEFTGAFTVEYWIKWTSVSNFA